MEYFYTPPEEDLKYIEMALGFQLYDWQKDYLMNRPCRVPDGRRVGFTTIYIVHMLLSPDIPVHLYNLREVKNLCDWHYDFNYNYIKWFRDQLTDIYLKLSETPLKPKLRKVLLKGELE